MDDPQQMRDAAIERWLHGSVVPVFDRVMSGEEEFLDATEVFSGVEPLSDARSAQETHQEPGNTAPPLMGFAALNPSYGPGIDTGV